jgi:hypothetical protein
MLPVIYKKPALKIFGAEMQIQEILGRLRKPKQIHDSTYQACCPAHDDNSPSMTITQAPDGKILFHCFTGCETYDILAAIGLRWGDLFPDTDYKSDKSDLAREIWDMGGVDVVSSHPYAMRKGITHDFGARRGQATGSVVGRNADCLILPLRSWDHHVVGVEVINWEGAKQTFGNKGVLVLGYPEESETIHICEGWATAWACAQLRPKSFGCIVSFGGGRRIRQVAGEASNRFRGRIVVHEEPGNRDVWDLWKAGRGDLYMRTHSA